MSKLFLSTPSDEKMRIMNAAQQNRGISSPDDFELHSKTLRALYKEKRDELRRLQIEYTFVYEQSGDQEMSMPQLREKADQLNYLQNFVDFLETNVFGSDDEDDDLT